ncbi:hypothetical protein JCM15519_04300 [Fundidesulfovibrio butyratiphilus]
MATTDPFKGVEVFRAGDHVDSAGRRHTFSEADLDKIAAYDPAGHEAPLVIGHPESNAPAYGWVARVYREGGSLKADFKDVAPEFADLVKVGRFKKRSISLYPDGSLRHVGFLGAVPPALKGLKDVQFNEGEASTFEFGEDASDPEKSVLTRFAEAFLGMLAPGRGDKQAGSPAFKEEPMKGDKDETAVQVAALTAKMAEFSEALTAKDKQIADLKAANQALANRVDATVATGRRAEIAVFCEGLADRGRLTEYQRGLVVSFMEKLDGAGDMDFAEGDKTVKRPASDVFKAFLESLPVQVEFGEFATHGRAVGKPGGLDITTLAVKIRDKVDAAEKAGRFMSFAEAQAEVLREQEGGK